MVTAYPALDVETTVVMYRKSDKSYQNTGLGGNLQSSQSARIKAGSAELTLSDCTYRLFPVTPMFLLVTSLCS